LDIYSFIRSKDAAAHCRETGKVWTPFEMAVIIGRSDRAMAERHSAWRELIADYPDMPTQKNMHYESYDSLHKKLAEVLDREERIIALFKTPEPGAVYKYKVMWHGEYSHSDSVFTSFEKALADARDSYERDEAPELVIEKLLADDNGRTEAWTDYDGNLYDVYDFGCCGPVPKGGDDKLLGFSGNMFYVDIPVPFKRGDILTIRSGPAQDDAPVFVLDSIDRDDQEKHARRLRGEMSDGTDLSGWGFFADDSGLLYGDHTADYDRFEYYRGKLAEKDSILHYVNLFLKGEIPLPELLTMQCRIRLEHQLENDLRIDTHGCYIPEYLRAKNRLSQEEKEKQTNGLMPWLIGKLSIHQVEFLSKEFGCDTESVQIRLGSGGGHFMGSCAGIVHEEKHYAKTNDSRFNYARMVMAKMILESYGWTEAGWIDQYAEPDNGGN
jgi:hypothetical protein